MCQQNDFTSVLIHSSIRNVHDAVFCCLEDVSCITSEKTTDSLMFSSTQSLMTRLTDNKNNATAYNQLLQSEHNRKQREKAEAVSCNMILSEDL